MRHDTKPHDTVCIAGDNIAVIGEVDGDIDEKINFETLRGNQMPIIKH